MISQPPKAPIRPEHFESLPPAEQKAYEEACEAYLHWLSGLPAELNAEKYEDLDFSDITSQYVSPWVGASGRVVTLEGQFTAAELRLIADRMEGKSQD